MLVEELLQATGQRAAMLGPLNVPQNTEALDVELKSSEN